MRRCRRLPEDTPSIEIWRKGNTWLAKSAGRQRRQRWWWAGGVVCLPQKAKERGHVIRQVQFIHVCTGAEKQAEKQAEMQAGKQVGR